MSASEKNNVSRMSDYSDAHKTMADMLQRAKEISEMPEMSKCRGIVIFLNDEEDQYDIGMISHDIRSSELISVLSIAKQYFIDELSI